MKKEKPKKKRKNWKYTKTIFGTPKSFYLIGIFVAFFMSLIILLFTKKLITSIIWFFVLFILIGLIFYGRNKMKESAKIQKMEAVFPDFLQLMASNLRAGMTTDRSLLLSARKEFDPLDKEIMKVGKDIVTGREIEESLTAMADRINSEKIRKTINLIVSGIKSGGNMATLLEQTAVSTRERNFVEKRAASSVLMYVIFIFVATAFGAPALFALSTVLVQVLTNILSTIPTIETGTNLPFTLSAVSVSVKFITYFSLSFIVVTDVLGSIVLGLVSKGDEKAGIRFMIPLVAISVTVFLSIRAVLGTYFSGIF